MSESTDDPRGIVFAGAAYVIWGIVPVYWRLLGDVPPFELTVHRVLWCTVFLVMVSLGRGHLNRLVAIVSEPRLLATLALTSVLITCNWTLYIWCVSTNRLVEASLGYYITPLVSFAAGYAFFGERMSRLRLAGVALATLALVVQAAALGHIPWISPALALSFGFYGIFRKQAVVTAMDGLLVETALLFPVTLGLVIWWGLKGSGVFPSTNLLRDALLICGGPLTAIPLAMFAAGARRVRLTTLGFLQYLAPSITLLLAVFAFHERFTPVNAVVFGCVWSALGIVALERRFTRFRQAAASSGH